MEHKGLHHGDIVHLLSENKIVALGRVHTTEPSDLCHGELLENGFCSISIDKCLDIQAYLPFPTIDASMVNEVVGGFVKWDIQNVKTVKEVEMNGHTYAATSPNDFIFEANGAPNIEDGISLQESWRERKVMLWSKENIEVLGYGLILLALPYEVINFDLLGEEDVGVVVDKSYNESVGTCTIDDLVCINLVRWPIKRLTFEDRTPLIQEESTKTPTLEDATMVDECRCRSAACLLRNCNSGQLTRPLSAFTKKVCCIKLGCGAANAKNRIGSLFEAIGVAYRCFCNL
ncbi:hypothetical protein L7F22_044873 [Adiantum nelumboides]|nr:hypothetical protein [Adiantum nelumboides]